MRLQNSDAHGLEWDPDHDYGTTFSIFAGWFLVLVSYLCKLRDVASIALEDNIDDDDVVVDEMLEESIRGPHSTRDNEAIVKTHHLLRERFLRRRVQCYDAISSQKSSDMNNDNDKTVYTTRQSSRHRNGHDLVIEDTLEEKSEGVDDHNDDNMSVMTRSGKGDHDLVELTDKKARLREKFLTRRKQIQMYADVEIPASSSAVVNSSHNGDTQTMKVGMSGGKLVQTIVHDALKDAYFGQTVVPEPFDFTIGRIENTNKEEVRQKVTIKTMERFLRRRVQAYASTISEKSQT